MSESHDQPWHHSEANTTRRQRASGHGLSIADTLDEIKNFAYSCFDNLDKDHDQFLEPEELKAALDDPKTDWRTKSFITFLLRRIDDIAAAYHEEWAPNHPGISRADIQEYFRKLKDNL